MIRKLLVNTFGKIEEKLNKGRFIFRKITKKEKVIGLIESLHPFNTDYALIRFGNDGDGGYLIPNDIEGISACFSPGVFMVSDFEMDCLKSGMKIFLADKSVDKPNINIPESNYHFLKKFVGCINDDDFITMDDWVDSSGLPAKSDLLLQMDIEGYEYISIINMSDLLMNRFRIIVVEFHGLQDLWQPRFFDFADSTFNKILKTHTCVHIHPNNGDGMEVRLGVKIPKTAEFTFLRNDRISHKKPSTQFPHDLDVDNTNSKTMILPDNWFCSIKG